MREIVLDLDDLNPGQKKFLDCAAPQVLFAGGYGSGKTIALVLKLLQLKTLNPGVPGLFTAPNYRTLWAVDYRSLMKILKASVHSSQLPKVVDKQMECYLDFGDGVPVFLRSAKNLDGLDGIDVGWAVGDEIRYYDEQAYRVIIGRVRVPCAVPQKAFASTPAMNWVSSIFNTKDPDRVLITAPTSENLHNLAPGFIDDLRKSYSPRMQAALLEGRFTVQEGAVFEAFDPSETSESIVDYNPTIRDLEKTKVYLALDPGVREASYMFIAQTGELEWTVFDEYQPSNTSDVEDVQVINAKGYPIDEIWLDPASDNRQSISTLTSISVFSHIKTRSQRGAVRSVSVYRDVVFGIDKLRVLLGGYNGMPYRIKFSRSLLTNKFASRRGIIRSIASSQYAEAKDGKPILDTPLKDGVHEHARDALRYFAVSRWLCEPKLRDLDAMLRSDSRPGWRVHAA